MPLTRSTKSVRRSKTLKEDPQKLILALETKLRLLQRNYHQLQRRLEKLSQENKRLKNEILGKIEDEEICLTRTNTSDERGGDDIYSEIEQDDGDCDDDVDFQEGSGDSLIEVKQECVDDTEYDVMGVNKQNSGAEENEGQCSEHSEDKSFSEEEQSNYSDVEEDDSDQETNKYSKRKSQVRKRKKSPWPGSGRIGSIGRRRTGVKVWEVPIPTTAWQRTIVNFLDDIANIPKSCSRKEPEDISLYDMSGLEPFHIVLKKQLDSYLEKEISSDANSIIPKHAVKFFSSPPSPSAHLPARKRNTHGSHSSVHSVQQTSDPFEEDLTPNLCEVCGVSCGTLVKLKRHMISHSTGTHSCQVCGKLFKRKDDMNKHIQGVHERIYKFPCTMCPKKFADASGFRRHERVHLGIKRHLCSVCGKRFPELNNLRLHIKSQHTGKEQPHRVKIIL